MSSTMSVKSSKHLIITKGLEETNTTGLNRKIYSVSLSKIDIIWFIGGIVWYQLADKIKSYKYSSNSTIIIHTLSLDINYVAFVSVSVGLFCRIYQS